MGKVRSKDLKPGAGGSRGTSSTKKSTKKTKDFEKSKTKVGRKLQPANATKITVQTKKIVVPSQALVHSSSGEDAVAQLRAILKHLKHFSVANRQRGLQDLQVFVQHHHRVAENYLTIVLPDLLEMLSKNEKDVREPMIEVFATMLKQFRVELILPVMDVMISYICSGLTHIAKSIRKDALRLLEILLGKCRRRISGTSKVQLLEHVLAILLDRSVAINAAAQSLALDLAKMGVLEREAVKTQRMKQTTAVNSTSAPSDTMLRLCLSVLQALLCDGRTQGDGRPLASGEKQEDSVSLECRSSSMAILLVQSLQARHDRLRSADNELLPQASAEPVVHRMNGLWCDLCTQETLPLTTVEALQQIVTILQSTLPFASLATAKQLVAIVLQYFPLQCHEAQAVNVTSQQQQKAQCNIMELNLMLCEMVLNVSNDCDEFAEALQFLQKTLRRQLEDEGVLIDAKVAMHIFSTFASAAGKTLSVAFDVCVPLVTSLQQFLQLLTLGAVKDSHRGIVLSLLRVLCVCTDEVIDRDLANHAAMLTGLWSCWQHVPDILVRYAIHGNEEAAVIRSLRMLLVTTCGWEQSTLLQRACCENLLQVYRHLQSIANPEQVRPWLHLLAFLPDYCIENILSSIHLSLEELQSEMLEVVAFSHSNRQ